MMLVVPSSSSIAPVTVTTTVFVKRGCNRDVSLFNEFLEATCFLDRFGTFVCDRKVIG
jgi:hypothetical protein